MKVLEFVLANADVALHAGSGCDTLRLSRSAAQALVARGEIGPDDAARACRVAVLIGQHGVVTALRPANGAYGRCYRRQMATRAARMGEAGR
jgi:hypothetical protein